jgi:hypothetical protein
MSRVKEGLGIKYLRAFNFALIGKWRQRLKVDN